jgi:hypothetical protein
MVELNIGDVVWFNEGSEVGYILAVIKSPTEMNKFGQNEPCLLISNHHPFKPFNDFINHDNVDATLWPFSSIDDEGIEPLNKLDQTELNSIVKLSFNQLSLQNQYSYHKVFIEILDGIQFWKIQIFNQESKQISQLISKVVQH